MEEKKTIASEGGHWYSKDGTPAYTIIGKNGKERATTLRDARKEGYLPSVTTILQVLPKPALINWMKKQVLMSALTLTREVNEADQAYIDRIMLDADEQARKAREKGTWIHGQIERYLLGQEIDKKAEDYIWAVNNELKGIMSPLWRAKCEPEKSFAYTPEYGNGFGGKVDLHSRELNFVCDFKTKEFDETTEKLAWDEQIFQLEAYRHGLGMHNARMLNVFISTNNPGLVRVVEHENGNDWHWNVFKDALKFWYTWKKY
jgi:hypothetical protein